MSDTKTAKPVNSALVKAIEDKLITARVGMLISQPFWGNLATRLRLVDATDQGWCDTAATDGRSFFYNRDFVNKCSMKETQFLVGHEIGHCVLDHFSRRGDRHAKIWNFAGDFVINLMLVEGKVGDSGEASYKVWMTETEY